MNTKQLENVLNDVTKRLSLTNAIVANENNSFDESNSEELMEHDKETLAKLAGAMNVDVEGVDLESIDPSALMSNEMEEFLDNDQDVGSLEELHDLVENETEDGEISEDMEDFLGV